TVIALMLDRFSEQYASIEKDVRVPNRSVHEILTMASIVQREAARTEEMPRIAAVFWNRLDPERGAETVGRLGADPTVQYALGYSQQEQTWWRKELTAENLLIASPYNTRQNTGLTPGPISAPGLAALQAAGQPEEDSPYLYFVASCARDGTHQFAATLAEFQQYEAAYLACSGG
ncbi:MAG: endolytic transglycosylase MltG, partial [Chloroflexales bacterium]|nr:endolytic transglycosylase MltG [Chloroflexales bacterium]